MRVHHRECFFSSTIGGKSRRFAEKVPLQPRSHGEPGLHAVPEAHCRLQEVARWPRNPAVLCRCRNGLAKKSAEAPGRRTDARVAPATSTARVGAGRCPAVRNERCRNALEAALCEVVTSQLRSRCSTALPRSPHAWLPIFEKPTTAHTTQNKLNAKCVKIPSK